jgi:hypothetical protein
MEAWHQVSAKRRVAAYEIDLLVKGHRAREFIDTFVHRRSVFGNELRKSGDTCQQERTNEKATAYTTVRFRRHREILLREMVRRKKGRIKTASMNTAEQLIGTARYFLLTSASTCAAPYRRKTTLWTG